MLQETFLCTNCNFKFKNRNEKRSLKCPYCNQTKYIIKNYDANKIIAESNLPGR